MNDDSDTMALDRALRLLWAILADDGTRPLATLARELNLPISTAHRFVDALLRNGLILRVGRGRYAGSYELAGAGGVVRARAILARVARKPLRRLAVQTGTSVHLGVLEGDMITYLVKEWAGAPLFTEEGMQLEAYCSAVGKLLLAHLPAATLEAYLKSGPFVPLTSATIIDPVAIRLHLDRVRAQDFAVDDREVDDQLGCVAVPVRGLGGEVIAALSCSASPPRPVDDRTVAEIRECANAIELELGRGCSRPFGRAWSRPVDRQGA